MIDLHEYLKHPGKDYRGDEVFTVVGAQVRRHGYATTDDLVEMGRWKFKGLYAKKHVAEIRTNKDKAVRIVTRIAFALSDEQAVELLTALNGVSVPMASTILTTAFPDRFAVIDVRAWGALYRLHLVQEEKRTFTPADYALYMRIVKRLADENRMEPRQVDIALWAYDKQHRKDKLY